MTAAMHRRVRQIRQRCLIRAWEYRQRDHAKGVWFRLRCLLARSESAWAVSEEDAARLVADGVAPEPVGAELAPPRTIFVVPPETLATLVHKRQLRVALDRELLETAALVLVPFTVSAADTRPAQPAGVPDAPIGPR